MKKLKTFCEVDIKEIDNGFILKIRKRGMEFWEVHRYIEFVGHAGSILDEYLVKKEE